MPSREFIDDFVRRTFKLKDTRTQLDPATDIPTAPIPLEHQERPETIQEAITRFRKKRGMRS